MSSRDLATEWLGKADASVHVIVSLGRMLLNEVIGLRLRAGSGGVSGSLLTLVVLTILAVQLGPTPPPTPAPLPV